MRTAKIEYLRERLGEVLDVQASVALLEWDQEVNMPGKAAAGRALQLGTLGGLGHGLFANQGQTLLGDSRGQSRIC